MGQLKKQQILVGFALETENELENAIGKLKRKNLDAIILNSLQDAGAGFQLDTNQVTFIDRFENKTTFALQTKKEVAKDIINQIIKTYHV
jgi:phosphopantothenoylcysteine decarboxylase/phosphopantothenate--cysteine ligase